MGNDPPARTGLNRRRVLKATGALATVASFAGCSGGGDGEGGGDGGTEGTATPAGDGDTVEMDGFQVPQENVVPRSELSDEQELRTIKLITPPKSSRPNDFQLMQVFAEAWAELGIDVEVQIENSTVRLNKAWSQNEPPEADPSNWWDISYWYFSPRPGRNDPDTLLYNLYHPSQQHRYNFVWFENEEVTQLVEEQRGIVDDDERQQKVHETQETIHDIAPHNFYYWPDLIIPWDTKKWENWVNIPGLGSRNMVSHSNVEPKTDDRDLVCLQPLQDEIDNLAPFGINGTAGEMQSRVMWERLAWPGEDGRPQPRLATEFNYTDETTIEVPLRQDSKWTDGTQTLAEDVKFTYDTNKRLNTTFASVLEPVEEIEIADDYRLIFHLKRPFAPIETVTFSRLGIGQKKHWTEIFESDDFDENSIESGFHLPDEFVTNGPLKFKSMDRQRQIWLERFDDHWDPIAYDTRLTKFVNSTSAALNQLQEREADTLVIYGGDKGALKQLVNDTDHLEYTAATSNTAHFLVMNNDQPPFHLPEFRRAVHHRMPKQQAFSEIFNEHGEYGAGNTSVTPGIDFWYNDDLTQFEFSKQAAANALVEGEFMWDEEEGKLWMPEDGWYLADEDVKAAEEYDFSRDSLKE